MAIVLALASAGALAATDEAHEPDAAHEAPHAEGHHTGGHPHRLLGAKAILLEALHEDKATSWIGPGAITELQLAPGIIGEIAVSALWGTPAAPGFAVPADVLIKWGKMIGPKIIVTAGAGPSLTWMRHEGESLWFPGALASVGGSYWMGARDRWGILAEIDAGGALEEGGIVPEIETAVGVVVGF